MEKKSTNPTKSWLIIGAIALTFLALYQMNPNKPSVLDLTQVDFYKALNEQRIVEPLVRFLDRDEGQTFLTG